MFMVFAMVQSVLVKFLLSVPHAEWQAIRTA
jgi:hypothetical protein